MQVTPVLLPKNTDTFFSKFRFSPGTIGSSEGEAAPGEHSRDPLPTLSGIKFFDNLLKVIVIQGMPRQQGQRQQFPKLPRASSAVLVFYRSEKRRKNLPGQTGPVNRSFPPASLSPASRRRYRGRPWKRHRGSGPRFRGWRSLLSPRLHPRIPAPGTSGRQRPFPR